MRDAALIGGTILITVIFQSLFCSKGGLKKNDVNLINEAFKDLNLKDAKIASGIIKRHSLIKNLKFFQIFIGMFSIVIAFWSYKSPGFYFYLMNDFIMPAWALFLTVIALMYGINYLSEHEVLKI